MDAGAIELVGLVVCVATLLVGEGLLFRLRTPKKIPIVPFVQRIQRRKKKT